MLNVMFKWWLSDNWKPVETAVITLRTFVKAFLEQRLTISGLGHPCGSINYLTRPTEPHNNFSKSQIKRVVSWIG